MRPAAAATTRPAPQAPEVRASPRLGYRDARMAVAPPAPSGPATRPAVGLSAVVGGLVVAAWVVGCDTWVKITARVATCPSTPSVREAAAEAWGTPSGCGEASVWGIAQLAPVARGGPLGLPGGATAWAIVLLVVAAIVSVLVLRWRWRSPGDASALGALWGGALAFALPPLAGAGVGTAELHLAGLHTGLADLALGWAAAWLGWRAIAELRA